MTERVMTDGWEARARAAATQRRIVWIWSPVFLVTGLLAVIGGLLAPTDWIRWPGLVCGGLLATWGVIYGTAIYIRTVDEQERDANLWGCYVGMCVYVVLFLVNAIAEQFARPVPRVHDAIFFVAVATTLGVFAWKRFR